MNDQLALLPGYLTAHLQLTLVALFLGAGVSIPLGVAVTRRHRLEGPVLGTAGVVQTIPSLALLAIMVPALAGLASLGIAVRSIGYLPAIIALTLYSVLPILRNTVTGIRGVDAALLEAADGVGMTPGERLRRVELPLAMPVIVAGLRTATVWVVGTATLSTPVGATSLGNFIFTGLQTRNEAAILTGCVAAAGLAVLLDQLIRLVESGLRERRRRRVAAASAVLGLLVAYAGWAALPVAGGGRTITIGSKTFTEQYILSEVLAQWVEAGTGRETRAVQSLGNTVLLDAVVAGDLDVIVDYSGTIWAEHMGRKTLPGREQVLAGATRWLEEEKGLTVVGGLGFQNTYALGMRRAQADALGVRTVSDLAAHASTLSIGADYVFFERAEWTALQQTYGLAFASQRSMDPALMYEAVAAGDVDVISAYSTDGRIAALDLVMLEDDRGVIPPYDAMIIVSARLAREAPEAVAALRRLVGRIDESRMQRMNFSVDDGGLTPAEVARRFLAAEVER